MEKHTQSADGPKMPKLIVVLGPTAVGKSDVAVQIALAIRKLKPAQKTGTTGAEIISADSRQVYAGLDIGSGKITKKEMLAIPHHGLDIVSPKRRAQFSVAEFKEYADKKIGEIHGRGNIPILCGGTGFYIDAVVDGMVLPEVKTDLKLRKELDAYDTEKLIKLLSKLDKDRLKQIDTNNRVRLIRSIEIAKALGKVPAIKKIQRYDTLIIGLDTKDELLKKKIELRIQKRLKDGMIEETKKLHESGVSWKRMERFGLEYGLLAKLLQKQLTLSEFTERLTFDIWHFVRRQRVWFKRRDDIKWHVLPSLTISKSFLAQIQKDVRTFLAHSDR